MKKMQIGKHGLTDEFLEQLKHLFEEEKMIRISILPSGTRNRTEAGEMAKKIVSELGQNYTCKKIGYTLVVQKWRKAKV